MTDFTDGFNEHSKALKAKAAALDREDYLAPESGTIAGRTRNHITKTDIDPATGKKRKTASDLFQETLEWLLLNNPAYKLAHQNLMTAIRDTQDAAQTALDNVMSALASKRAMMDKLLSTAAKLPDGRYVFKDKDGNVRDEDGEIIAPELAATIKWTGHEPGYEYYHSYKRDIEALEQAEQELRGIETELGEMHNNANSNAAPRTPEELYADTNRSGTLKERIDEIEAGLQGHVKPTIENTINPVVSSDQITVAIPVMPKK